MAKWELEDEQDEGFRVKIRATCSCGRTQKFRIYAEPHAAFFDLDELTAEMRRDGWHVQEPGSGRTRLLCPSCAENRLAKADKSWEGFLAELAPILNRADEPEQEETES